MAALDRAIDLCRKSAELDPLSYLPYTVLTSAYYSAGSLDEAEEALKTIVELNPEYHYADVWRARFELARSRPEAALEHADRLTDPGARKYWRVLTYYAMGRDQVTREGFGRLLIPQQPDFVPTCARGEEAEWPDQIDSEDVRFTERQDHARSWQ